MQLSQGCILENHISFECPDIWLFYVGTKAELPQKGISSRTQFPSLGIFINKKVGFLKN